MSPIEIAMGVRGLLLSGFGVGALVGRHLLGKPPKPASAWDETEARARREREARDASKPLP